MKLSSKVSLSAIMVAIVATVLVVHNVFDVQQYKHPESVINWDVINFYSYLPAAFVEHDLTLSFVWNDPEGYFQHYWPEDISDGKLLIKTTMGLSMLYCPFFLVANVLAEPLGYVPDGFSEPYALAIILACIFWVVVGCIFLRKVLLQRFSEVVTTIVIGVTVFATNLLWYSTTEAPYSHGFLFGLFCIFLWQTERWHKKPSWWGSVAVGLNLGLVSLIRPTNALVLLYFVLYDITTWKELKERFALYLQHWPKILVMALSALTMWVPQMIYWHTMTGHLLFYSYTNNERFFWTDPKLFEFIFGFRKGWLIYTPVMVFAILGLIPLYKRHRRYFYATIVFLVLNIYVLSCWWCWWFGGCFGQRSMVDCYGLLAVPLAAFVEWMLGRKKAPRIIVIVVFAAVTYLSFFHYKQYKHQAIHYEAMSAKAYFDSFGHKYPSQRFNSLLVFPDYEAAKQGNR